ncbi:MAG TPA: CHRD domain-containing protein, partial [Acidimicrobiales bacterium]|nr:CHRD domain-containing protein [Acidimicrobiales bacterium]
ALCVVFVLTTVLATMTAGASAGDAYLIAYMNGPNERPGPGDPDAVGRATITIDDEANRLCLTMWWYRVDGTLSGLHIHLAPPTAPGPVVIPFAVPTGTSTYQCITVENEALLDNVAANPGQYYINLHSTPVYPAGAIRGQLTRL